MTDDLTKNNHAIVKKLLQLRKAKQINGFWSLDAKIYLKVSTEDAPVRVNSLSDISSLALTPPVPPAPIIPPAPLVATVAPVPTSGDSGAGGRQLL